MKGDPLTSPDVSMCLLGSCVLGNWRLGFGVEGGSLSSFFSN